MVKDGIKTASCSRKLRRRIASHPDLGEKPLVINEMLNTTLDDVKFTEDISAMIL